MPIIVRQKFKTLSSKNVLALLLVLIAVTRRQKLLIRPAQKGVILTTESGHAQTIKEVFQFNLSAYEVRFSVRFLNRIQ